MQVTPLAISDVLLIEPKVFGDARGFFYESFNQRAFNEATGSDLQFVQDNHSRSSQGVLRGDNFDAHDEYDPRRIVREGARVALRLALDHPDVVRS